MKWVCLSVRLDAFSPLTTYIGMKLGMAFEGKGLIFQKNFARSPDVKGQVKIQVAWIEFKFGEGDIINSRTRLQNVYRGALVILDHPSSSSQRGSFHR